MSVTLFTLSDKDRSKGDVGVIEWTPGKWWVVQVTGPDGSFTPLYEGKNRDDAERWASREQFYHDVFVTALEGGIGYWSVAEVYRWSRGDSETPDLTGFEARIIEVTDECSDTYEGAPRHTVTREVIARGIEALATGKATWGGKALGPKLQAFYAGIDATNGESGDVDSSSADNIVQAGLFNDVRYG
jgi:hypothetical protein